MRADKGGSKPRPMSTESQADTLPKNNVQSNPTRTPSVARDREATAMCEAGTVFKISGNDETCASVVSSITPACPTVFALSRSAVNNGCVRRVPAAA